MSAFVPTRDQFEERYGFVPNHWTIETWSVGGDWYCTRYANGYDAMVEVFRQARRGAPHYSYVIAKCKLSPVHFVWNPGFPIKEVPQ